MKRSIGVAAFIAVLSLVFAAAIYAASKAPDVIEMKAPYDHKQGIVQFTHQKHITDYKLGCGECHHDDKGQPLTNLKEGDEVKSCFACHKEPGELKGKKAEGLSKAEKLAYHANALHTNCQGCHKEFKSKNPKTTAPTTKCTDCHPKEKK